MKQRKISDSGEIPCPHCGGNAFIITRVTGYFSKSNAFNKGKLSELKQKFIYKDGAFDFSQQYHPECCN